MTKLKRYIPLFIAGLAITLVASGCGSQDSQANKYAQQAAKQEKNPPKITDPVEPALKVSTAAPGPGEGDNISPPMHWSHVPARTAELLLVCEDPDAPARHPFIHWMLRIPATATRLPEGLPAVPNPDAVPGLVQGVNGAERCGWHGMLPPPGHGPHHYYFELFALDRVITLPATADGHALLAAITGHVIAEGHHVGRYERH